jgi:hypothetical protein
VARAPNGPAHGKNDMVRRLTMEVDTIARTAAHCGMAAGGGATLGRDGRASLCATYEEKKVGG